jgi:hypothetical protein
MHCSADAQHQIRPWLTLSTAEQCKSTRTPDGLEWLRCSLNRRIHLSAFVRTAHSAAITLLARVKALVRVMSSGFQQVAAWLLKHITRDNAAYGELNKWIIEHSDHYR